MARPTPHYQKLVSLLANDKLPIADRERVKETVARYKAWIEDLEMCSGKPEQILEQRIALLQQYKRFVDLELIYDSKEDFLYRQKGQLKLDNSVIEEFLPWIACKEVVPELPDDLSSGPTNCYASIYFEGRLNKAQAGGGLHIRSKDQDFALSRKLFIAASHQADFKEALTGETFIAYGATEMKTNLDKTMFQEACATARDLKLAVPSSRYYLMVEWLDMTPLSTAPTDIERVLLLRRAKRLASNVRADYGTYAGRVKGRDEYAKHLDAHPFDVFVFRHWLDDIVGVLTDKDPEELSVLEAGYF